MLNGKFEDAIRYRLIARTSILPLGALGIGLWWEFLAGQHKDLQSLLIMSAAGTRILFIFGAGLLKYLDDELDHIWDVALNRFEANISLSVECDRKPLDGNRDCLIIKVKISKGDRGFVTLSGARARAFARKEKD